MRPSRLIPILLLVCLSAFAQAPLLPNAAPQIFDSNGKPLAGGKIQFYLAGTTNPVGADTYSDPALTAPNPNPIILNVAGRPTSASGAEVGIFLRPITYKVVIKNAAGSTVRAQDNVGDVGAIFKADLALTSGANLVGFKQDGAGALPSTVDEELLKIHRVSQFATCNGSADDTVKAQAALDALPAGGVLTIGAGCTIPGGLASLATSDATAIVLDVRGAFDLWMKSGTTALVKRAGLLTPYLTGNLTVTGAIAAGGAVAASGVVSGTDATFSGVGSFAGGIAGGIAATTPLRFCTIPLGPIAYASVGISESTVITTTYISGVFIPANVTVNGVSVLLGSGTAMNNLGVGFYGPSGGAAIASSVPTAASGSANALQDIPFTAPISIIGPGVYWIALQGSNTSNTFQAIPALYPGVATTSITSGTFGAFPSLTPPSTFSSVVGPVACIY